MNKKVIRIASGSGFWGDWPQAPLDQVYKGDIDYLVMDYLAEVTMSILQKLNQRDPSQGYARDFLRVVDSLLPEMAQRDFTILTNAGGVNPHVCKDEVLRIAENHDLSNLRVAVVEGDDVRDLMNQMMEEGHEFQHLDTGQPFRSTNSELQSAHAYLGSEPMIVALQQQADIVITGRVIDAGLTVAPLAYEFGWNMNQYDRLATATVAGHLIECGGQVSGGNFTDWENVDDLNALGFPIIEAYPDGIFDITKHRDTGGLINSQTVKEQLVYEIRDPESYLTADVSTDFTSLTLSEIDTNRVRISGVKGKPAPDSYKVSANYFGGYKMNATLTYSWPRALEKARDSGEVLKQRIKSLHLEIDELRFDFVGFNACHEQSLSDREMEKDHNEIQLRITACSKNEQDLNRLGKEIAPLILTGPPGATGFAGGRPKASPMIAFWPTLIDKTRCNPEVNVFDLNT